jgi:transcription antitermination protein NusB
MGTRRKARECSLQMLFAADVAKTPGNVLTKLFWDEIGEPETDDATREFANNLVLGVLNNIAAIDENIRVKAEHWRISRMAIVDRNVLRLAVYEFLFESTPNTVVINEALEIARQYSTFEATQFINGILDAIKNNLEKKSGTAASKPKPVANDKET